MKTISNKDLYTVLARIEDKVDERMDRIENRVGTLERFKAQALVLGTTVVFFLTFFGDLVRTKIFGKA